MKNANKCAEKAIKKHEKKLGNITIIVTLPLAVIESVHNLSNVTITSKELGLLKYCLILYLK